MLKHVPLGLAVLLVAGFASATPGWAAFKVCNHSKQQVDVAFAYPHTQFGWTSEGWWTLATGQCRTIMKGPLNNRYYYLYATGSKGSIWQAPAGQKGGFFCIQRDRFVLPNRNNQKDGVLDCSLHNLQAKQFFLVDTGGATNHVHNLRD
jgi:uncharacterized membrane protein